MHVLIHLERMIGCHGIESSSTLAFVVSNPFLTSAVARRVQQQADNDRAAAAPPKISGEETV